MLNICIRAALCAVLFIVCFVPTYPALKTAVNQADYIMIFHPQFGENLKELAAFRQAQGLNVLLVNVNDVYTEFEGSHSEAVRSFISYALTSWQEPKPKYILLAGSINHIPSYKIKSFYQPEDSVSLDEYFVINNNETDKKPDAAIGRLPARNSSDLRNMIARIIHYESQSDMADHAYDIVNLTDAKDFEDFDKQEKTFLNSSFPDDTKIRRLTRYTWSENFTDLTGLIGILNSGTRFFNLFTHGSPSSWLYENMVTDVMLDSIKLKNKPFVLMAVSCSQRFDNPDKKGIIELIMTMESGGAVATFAPAGVGLSTAGTQVLTKFYNNMFLGESKTIGDIILNVKRSSISKSTPIDDMYHRFSLLGDPAMTVKSDLKTSIENQPEEDLQDCRTYPNPSNDVIHIAFDVTGDNQSVVIDISDACGREVDQVINSSFTTEQYRVDYPVEQLQSGIYFCRINIDSDRFIKQIVVAR